MSKMTFNMQAWKDSLSWYCLRNQSNRRTYCTVQKKPPLIYSQQWGVNIDLPLCKADNQRLEEALKWKLLYPKHKLHNTRGFQ